MYQSNRVISTLALALLAMISLSGCASFNPIAAAETPGQRYVATKLVYESVLEAAVKVIEDPTAPAQTRRNMQSIVANSRPIYESLTSTYSSYQIARLQYAAGETTQEHLQTLTINLEDWIEEFDRALLQIATSLNL